MSWKTVKLGDVFSQIKNGASIKQTDGFTGIPITRIETISNSNIDFSKLGYANINDESYKDFYLENGDILMSHINSWTHLGKNAIVENLDQKIIHGMNLLLLKANKELLYPKYSKHYFDSDLFRNQIDKISNQSVNQSSFSVTKLRELIIPLPPLATQKRIAEILDAADALRRKDQELLKKYDELAQAIFIDMFGDIKSNSKNLKEITFKDICTLSQGLQIPISERKKTPGSNKFPYITNQFLNGGKVVEFIENPRQNVVCNIDDVLMTRTGNTGVVLTDVSGVFHNNFFKISYDKSVINKRYLVEYLKNPFIKATVLKMASTTTIPDLNHGDFYRIKFLLPDIDLQNKYGRLIDEQIKLRQSIDLNLDQSDDLFNSLIQKAFKDELVV